MQESAKKLKNWGEFVVKKTDRARQARIDELSMHQEKNRETVSQLLAYIRELQIRANSLSYTRELYDLESGSSSGATHVPDQTSTILSPRTLPRCDSGLPCDTQDGTGFTRNYFERPPAQEGLSSAIFNNSKNLASSSQVFRPGTL